MSPDRDVEAAVTGVAELLEARIGLRSEPTVRARLRRCVRDEAAAQRLDPEDYLRTVAVDGRAFAALLDRVTVQETGFFRHPEQFAVLADAILPAIGPPVRIWSAGCANGQEAYSLAMLLEERGVAGSVVATDLSPAALHRTAAGRYTAREVAGLSPERVARHLVPAGAGWEVTPSLRDRVLTVRHNLVDALPGGVRSCQVVFCRNVLIYVEQSRARTFLRRVADEIAPVALFLGSAEAIWPVTDRFEAVRVGDAFVHRPRGPQVRDRETGPRTGTVPRATGPVPRGLPDGSRPTADRRRPDRRPGGTAPGAGEPMGAPRSAPVESGAAAAGADGAGALARRGQRALAAGDPRAAVTSFRKWSYLIPGDPLAQLGLGLALEAAGDRVAAHRAYAVASRLVLASDPADIERATEGFTREELLRLLEGKQGMVS